MLFGMGDRASRRETIADAMARGDGARFDQLRLAAAMSVIVSHAFEIAQGTRANEPFLRFSSEFTFGELAVLVFFTLSGFLLAHSLRRDASIARFAARRARRILPGLCGCVILLVFAVGPLLTIIPLADYFSSSETWAYFGNVAFAPELRTLPGVFETAPNGAAVNAPLWTLHYEVVCYALLAALAALGGFGPRAAAGMIAALFLIHPLAEGVAPPWISHYLRPLSLVGPVFFAGVLAARIGDRIPRDGRLALLAAAVFVVASVLGRPAFGFLFAGVYVVLFIATSRQTGLFRRITRGVDISYGVYLYGWPVQQALVTAGLATSVWSQIVFGLAGAVIAGALSARFVEAPFLRRDKNGRVTEPFLVKFLQNLRPARAPAIKSPD